MITTSNSTVSVVLQNIRSLAKNFDNFNVFLKTLRNEPAVLCLTETWLSEKYPNNIFKIDGYQTLVSVNRKRRGGGVAIYVKDTLNYKIISSFNENKLQITNPRNMRIVNCSPHGF